MALGQNRNGSIHFRGEKAAQCTMVEVFEHTHAVQFQLDLQVLLGQNPKCSSEAASSQTQICSVSSTAHLMKDKPTAKREKQKNT